MSDPNPLFSQTYDSVRSNFVVRQFDYSRLNVVCEQCRTTMLKQNDDPTDSKFVCPLCKRIRDPVFELQQQYKDVRGTLTTQDGTHRGANDKFIFTFESVSQKRIKEALTGKREHKDVQRYKNLIPGATLRRLEVNGEVVYDEPE